MTTAEPRAGARRRGEGATSSPRRAPERHGIFIGRDAELARILAAFAGASAGPDRGAIVAVQGMAGVGKTYLAQELYARHPERFGGYHHVVLEPEHPGAVATWLAILGERAGLEAEHLDEAAVAETLRARRALVHVDNVDSAAAAELAAALARALDGVPLLVTGRYAELGTAAGSGWTRLELAPLESAPALDLLQSELAGAGVHVLEAELRELVRQVAGLPLALHLAAGYLRRGSTVERFLARLRDRGLALDPRDPADHVLADRAGGVLATSFAISRELMLAGAGPAAAAWDAALAALGWAPRAGFGRSLGAALVGLPEAGSAFDDFIEAAVALSLAHQLRPEERPTAAWAVHPLLAEFLRARTARDALDARCAAWVARLADDAPADRADRWDALSVEVAALGEWLGAAGAAAVRELVTRGWAFATSRGPVGPWLAAARRVRRAGVGASRALLWALCQLAARAGELDAVQDAATALATLARDAGDERSLVLALGQLADVRFTRGELDEALRIRRDEVLPVLERLGDQRERANTLGRIADVLYARGELAEVLRIRRAEQLPIYEQLGDARARAVTLGQIADVLYARGELDEALRIRRDEVLPVYVQLGDARGRAGMLAQLADVLAARGQPDEALRLCRDEVLPVYERLGDVRSRAFTLGKIADLLLARGELDEVLRICREEELPVYERLGDVRSRAIAWGRIADVLAARGELAEALRIRREEQLPVYERLGDVRSRAITLGKIADVLAARGERAEAQRIYREEVLPVYERLGDVRARAVALAKLAALDQAEREDEPADPLRLAGVWSGELVATDLAPRESVLREETIIVGSHFWLRPPTEPGEEPPDSPSALAPGTSGELGTTALMPAFHSPGPLARAWARLGRALRGLGAWLGRLRRR